MKKKEKSPVSERRKEKTLLNEHRLWFYPLVLSVLALLAAIVVMAGAEADVLKRIEELNLFLDTPLFFRQQMVVPAGLLTWLGTYFTEFFYHPAIGATLLAAWCALLMWLVYRTFKLTPRWAPLLLLPLVLILLADFTQGYWIYIQKQRGLMFSTVIGFNMATVLTWVYRKLPPKLLIRPLFMVFTALAFYPLAGCYGLLAVVLMAVIDWRLGGAGFWRRIVNSVVAVVVIIAVPLIYYRTTFSQTAIEDLWVTGLPHYLVGSGVYYAYYLPYLLLALLLVILAVTYARLEPAELRHPWRWVAIHVVAVAAIVWGCSLFWYKDSNYHDEIRMNACIERCDWERLLDIARQADDPSRQMVLDKYLACFKLGRAGDIMYTMRDGDRQADCPIRVTIVETGGKPLYMHYGLQNFCHRWCMEDGVERGFRVEELRYLLRCAILNGEQQVAKKYIDLLKHTRYHGEWAEHYRPLIGDSAALAKDPELGPILPLTRYDNVLASDKSVIETFLIELLAHQQTDDPKCADLILMHALQSKDIPTFWRAFFQYASLHTGQPMPRHYQEAALLYGNLEHNVDISHMPFDKNVLNNYQEFMKMAQQSNGASEEQMAKAFYPRFGDTFFYNYFLRRGVKTY